MIDCIDLFAGAGGLSLGLRKAGIKVRVAVEHDKDCEQTYLRNFPGSVFLRDRIQNVTRSELLPRLRPGADLVLAGGPPCQLFSRLNRRPADITDEIYSYIRLVRSLRPMFVVFENVPAIKRRSVAWTFVTEGLISLGYDLKWQVVNCQEFGLPQKRERMIVLASKVPVDIPMGCGSKASTVRDAISHLPDQSDEILNHRGMTLSESNLQRIRKLTPGQNSRKSGVSFADSYARMSWDKPAPTITTKCISFSNGRFGHPEYDRAITVREAALLQGFPEDYVFKGSLWSCARQVGNAVPPVLAEQLGVQILKAYRRWQRKGLRKSA